MALVLYVPYNNLFINHTIHENSKMHVDMVAYHQPETVTDCIKYKLISHQPPETSLLRVMLCTCYLATHRDRIMHLYKGCNELFNANVSLSDTMDIALETKTPKGRNK